MRFFRPKPFTDEQITEMIEGATYDEDLGEIFTQLHQRGQINLETDSLLDKRLYVLGLDNRIHLLELNIAQNSDWSNPKWLKVKKQELAELKSEQAKLLSEQFQIKGKEGR